MLKYVFTGGSWQGQQGIVQVDGVTVWSRAYTTALQFSSYDCLNQQTHVVR